jgi:hypothetical protein
MKFPAGSEVPPRWVTDPVPRHPPRRSSMPEERSRSVKGLAVAGALAAAVGLATVVATAAEAPAQEDTTTTTVVEDDGGTTGTTVVPDDTTDDNRGGRAGDPDCERQDGPGDDSTGEESNTDV